MTNPILQAANLYAAQGWHVFPLHSVVDGVCTCGNAACKSPGKHPISSHGFKEATTDPERIAAWFDGRTRFPRNIGIATGNGILVLDIDHKPGKPDGKDSLVTLLKQHGSLPLRTLVAETGGGGAHMVYRVPDHRRLSCSAGTLGPSLDVRADGGYVVAWPSVGVNRTYAWLGTPDGSPDFGRIKDAPDWLLDLCERRATAREDASTLNSDLTSRPATPPLEESESNVARVRSALSVISADCSYDQWRTVVFATHSLNWDCGYSLARDWSVTAPDRFDESALEKMWHSARPDGGIGISSLFHLARVAGWVEHAAPVAPCKTVVPADADARAIAELAALSPVEYDRVRAARAEAMGIRVSTLDEQVERARDCAEESQSDIFPMVEPWPVAVDGVGLLTEIAATVRRFIACDAETADAAALWCAMTWLMDVVKIAPLAIVSAPEKRCGKSTLLSVIGKLVYRPLPTSNATSAALFRAIEKWQPTMLVDEVDTFMRDNEELRGVINSGHTREAAFVLRTVGDAFESQQFSTWGAKALSGIGNLPETIMDRAIPLRLRRKLKTEHVDRLRHAAPDTFDTLRRKLARFAADQAARIASARPNLPNALNDRAQDNWEPLLAIADTAGGEWPARARRVALVLSTGADIDLMQSKGVELLADIRIVFDQRKAEGKAGWDRLSSVDLLAALCLDDEAPWATYNRGKEMTPRQLANRLREYGIVSKTVRRGPDRFKGYELTQFGEAFNRYLPEDPPTDAAPSSDAPSFP
jgi:putative DNA primase/helicase